MHRGELTKAVLSGRLHHKNAPRYILKTFGELNTLCFTNNCEVQFKFFKVQFIQVNLERKREPIYPKLTIKFHKSNETT